MEMPSKEGGEVRREIPEPPSEAMNISMDGAMVHIRGEGWKEVKAVAVSAIRHLVDRGTGKVTTLLSEHSYRAGLWDASEFCQQQWAEACRRGVEKAGYLSSVNDGAAWIWNIVRMCYGNCVEIIDWWHAVEKLWLIGQHRFGAETEEATAWVSAQKQLLIEGSLRQLVRNIRLIYPRGNALPDSVRNATHYLFLIADVCVTGSSAKQAIPSAAARSSQLVNWSFNNVSNSPGAGLVMALKPCSHYALRFLGTSVSSETQESWIHPPPFAGRSGDES